MKDDLISRQAAIDAVNVGNIHPGVISALKSLIEEIPSAEPKKGRWIFAKYFVWECSECGKNPTKGMGYTQSRSELFRYCPYCGASMEVRE